MKKSRKFKFFSTPTSYVENEKLLAMCDLAVWFFFVRVSENLVGEILEKFEREREKTGDIGEILVRNKGDFLKWKSERNSQTLF